ncbi:MAG: hypothetical protein IKN39_03555 [Clostridia bacterium]|nr:hypothetical protein [Clostridia bacterium]
MKYNQIIKQLAKKNKISKKEVDLQMRSALKNSGINVSPEVVIQIAVEQIKKTIYNN